ncbi:thiamine pyrophosphate-dependent dehydrogenase E1 component subunit alpha [Neobacillus mesonae]|uniref:thiamine pyrophosphate-dependent dehydrogenase E1 component subunit alpha n=1 Tax=Neobacillus mesonae TaxID=1193713 RepID=UPI00203EB8C9|nr:thiamine pyrophosphate-dependent dehydrogenase E1 component subunit alpha [Neobacillus mesonae]MCM3567503.1 thiamine pyrophosphate-dependent dehydrogenase E1 component subunit alpha [Neobacillus mesonae]
MSNTQTQQTQANILSAEKTRWIYRKMVEIRKFEEAVIKGTRNGSLGPFAHTSDGQEAVAVGTCAHLNEKDYITSTHRGHGHSIAKGGDLNTLMAEMAGKATGCDKGKGGSLHLADLTKGNIGANGVVGGGLPIACGAGLTAKLTKSGAVTVAFFGDGANNQGVFHEALNLAAIWKLPVVFVCENNKYGEYTWNGYATAATKISDRAAGYNIPGKTINGNDVVEVYQTVGEAIERARNGEGPSLIECETFRIQGHGISDPQIYKTEEEKQLHLTDEECIKKFKSYVTKHQLLSDKEMSEIDQSIEDTVEKALQFAINSPYPDAKELYTDVYVSY